MAGWLNWNVLCFVRNVSRTLPAMRPALLFEVVGRSTAISVGSAEFPLRQPTTSFLFLKEVPTGRPISGPSVAHAILANVTIWSLHKENPVTVRFFPNDKQNPPGKLADAELHFSGGPLDGLKLVGFAVWERKKGGRNVTFPARQYSVNGERRSFALLRPIVDATSQDKLRDLILDAFKEHEAELAAAS
jgi:hypothetical protein